MLELIELCSVGLVAFVSTNLDDLGIVILLLSSGVPLPRIVAGQLVGMSILTIVSILVAAGSVWTGRTLGIPAELIGILGFAPIFLGVRSLISGDNDDDGTAKASQQITAIAFLTVTNGGDNLGIYIPLFMPMSTWKMGVMGLIFAMMTVMWCCIGQFMSYHLGVERYVKKMDIVIPYVLIGLGAYILWTSGAVAWLYIQTNQFINWDTSLFPLEDLRKPPSSWWSWGVLLIFFVFFLYSVTYLISSTIIWKHRRKISHSGR